MPSLFTSLLFGCQLSVAASDSKANNYYEDALKHYNSEHYNEAVMQLTNIYLISMTTLLTNTSIKHIEGDLEGALEGYAKIIAQEPDSRDARIGLLMDLNRNANSEGDFTGLAESASSDPRISYLRAVSFA